MTAAATKDTEETKDTKEKTEDPKKPTRWREAPFVSLVLRPLLTPSVSLFLIRDSGHLPRAEGRQVFAGAFEIEFRVGGLDAQEEPVPARQREAWHVEHRV